MQSRPMLFVFLALVAFASTAARAEDKKEEPGDFVEEHVSLTSDTENWVECENTPAIRYLWHGQLRIRGKGTAHETYYAQEGVQVAIKNDTKQDKRIHGVATWTYFDSNGDRKTADAPFNKIVRARESVYLSTIGSDPLVFNVIGFKIKYSQSEP